MGSATNVIMPVLGMSQDSGKLVRWIKKPGDRVEKGEPLMEVETDKATVEIESPAFGVLTRVTAQEGDEVPVGQVIAEIQDNEERQAGLAAPPTHVQNTPAIGIPSARSITPLAARMAADHNLDVGQIKPGGGRIEKEDVQAYLKSLEEDLSPAGTFSIGRPILASPKARRLAAERGIDLADIIGSGPNEAVLADDLPAAMPTVAPVTLQPAIPTVQPASIPPALVSENELPMSVAWGRMIERISTSWPNTPHFYLMREVNATRLIAWRQLSQEHSETKITYTDLLVKLAAMALRRHPQVNAHFQNGKLVQGLDVNVGIAVATDEDLLVPVIHRADTLRLSEIAAARIGLVERARAGKLRLEDLQGGTFTISNLGMYGVDAFNAIVNPGQSAILAVGRIADRVIALNGQAVVQPMLILSMSFDHRVVDGARGAQFLKTVVDWIEEPLALLD